MRSGFPRVHLYQCSLFVPIDHFSPSNLTPLRAYYHQLTDTSGVSADLERLGHAAKWPYSKIPSIFDQTVRNSSTIKSNYQQSHSIPEICATLGISRATLYRYVKEAEPLT